MNYKKIIQDIQEEQLKTFCRLDTFLIEGTGLLPKHKRGLYWLWTNLDFEQLKNAVNNHASEVPIMKLIDQRKELNHLCHTQNSGFKVVYNGIGGYKTNTRSFGLRERILQELNSKDHRTGTLNILNRFSDNKNWAISFFDFENEKNKLKFDFLNEPDAYLKYAEDLEKLWRLEFGHPILCRH